VNPSGTVAAVLVAAAGAARSGAIALRDQRAAWAIEAGAEALELAGTLVAAGPDWSSLHAEALRTGLGDVLVHLPDVRPGEARKVADGVSAAVSIIRRWMGA
jgi:hypothetical protein